MGFILLLILISAGISVIVYLGNDEDKGCCAAAAATICGTVAGLLMCVIWGISYSEYVSAKENYAVIEQYKESVELYAEKGVAEFAKLNPSYPGSPVTREFTDLKYHNYQVQLGQMIAELRDRIVKYNATVVSKRVMKDNWFWSWCIITGDELKPVKMGDYLE